MNGEKREIEQREKSIYAGQGNVYVQYGPDRRIPRALTPNPFLPELFLGREDDLQGIHKRLFTPGGHFL